MKIWAVLVLLSVFYTYAQDCKTAGQRCNDHEQCCGGCCVSGECVDTYLPCYASLDVCDDHSCIGEEICVPYTPPKCIGCEPVPLCRPLE